MKRREKWLPYLLIFPTLLFLACFFVWPLVQAFSLAFQSSSGAPTLEHLRRMADDFYFARALRDTAVMLVLIIPIQLGLALAAALIVNSRVRGSNLLLYLYALPLGISDLAAGLIWLSIFTERGYLNSVLYSLGFIGHAVTYLSYQSPRWLLAAVVITEVWRATPLVMVILLSGLQMIARDYLEAAQSFGASRWQQLWMVTLPLLKPSIQSALIIRTVLALQVFAPVIVLTGRLFPVLASESYFWYSVVRNDHVAAAYAVLMMVLSVAVTWVYLAALRTRQEHAGVV